MTLARRELSEPHGAHLAAHRLFAQGDAVFLVQPLREIAEPPAHDAVDGRNGTGFDQILQRTALRVVLPASMPYILAGMRISLALSARLNPSSLNLVRAGETCGSIFAPIAKARPDQLCKALY